MNLPEVCISLNSAEELTTEGIEGERALVCGHFDLISLRGYRSVVASHGLKPMKAKKNPSRAQMKFRDTTLVESGSCCAVAPFVARQGKNHKTAGSIFGILWKKHVYCPLNLDCPSG
jgi:hypothetical protein